MSIRYHLKAIAEDIPVPIGRLISAIPFNWRFGYIYSSMAKLACQLNGYSAREIREWSFPKVSQIVENSYRNNMFYRTICQRHNFFPEKLKTLEHFQDAPIVTKSDLREFSLDERSVADSGCMLVNTGGTSGEPLDFYIDRHAFAREWAHMHFIWKRSGYDYRDLKLTMRGRNMGEKLIKYNPVHNEWIVNTYGDRKEIFSALSKLMDIEEIRWIHGYPSIVSEMVSDMSVRDNAVIEKLRPHLKGVLLGSEFPAAQYIEPIRHVLGIVPTAWYGHSEMCVLAYDKGENHYIPMYSYGFVEAVGAGGDQRLLGTSYWNTASPFIRYDTGDRISADIDQGVVRDFSVTSGRTGDFVIDRDGTRIALTALVFGRHHAAFSKVRHVQVRQSVPGKIDLLLVPGDEPLTPDELMKGFDFSNVALDVTPVLMNGPVRTASGKLSLLVR